MVALDQPDQALDGAGLGRLRRVAEPREIWPTEAGAFTPWLAANLDVLADELGMALALVATEVPVGEFRLDIKAETADGRVVIIENQLERTDHGHLGQLLVYASGLEAAIVVWVAPSFRDDHRRTLDWINERTYEAVSFFGVELAIVQIADGPRAPVFEVVSRPNDWQKQVKSTAGGGVPSAMSPLNDARQDFFHEVLQRIHAANPAIRVPTRANANWLSFASGPFGYWAFSVTQDRRVRLEAYLDCGDRDRNKALFDYVREHVDAPIPDLSWERLPERRACRIAVYYDHVPPYDAGRKAEALAWATQSFLSMYAVYDPVLRSTAQELRAQQAPGGAAPTADVGGGPASADDARATSARP